MATCPHCGSNTSGDICSECAAPLTTAGRATKARAAAASTTSSSVAEPRMDSIAVPALELIDVSEARSPSAGGAASARASQPQRELRRGDRAAAYLSLQRSEEAILHAASRILAAYLQIDRETPPEELADRAVQLATRMALVTERYVQSDDEDW